jgi:hypothetical protein
MSNCSSCATQLPDDFGLVTCPNCGAQAFIDFNGAAVSASVDMVASTSTQSPENSQRTSVSPQQEAHETIEKAAPQPASALSDMSDIADFGNSSASQGREGLLRFDIYLSGIDTADIRQEVLGALDDAKFLWDAQKILAGVQMGELTLKGLTAVKAAVFIQRLRAIPIEIRWEQYAIHQA